jgi:hypothetical protein
MSSRRVLIVRSTSKAKITDRTLAAVCTRLDVIELQELPRTTAPPVLRLERAAAVVAYVNFASNLSGQVTRALRCTRSVALDAPSTPRLPTDGKALLL